MVPTMATGKKIAEQPHLSKISAAKRGKAPKSWRVLPMGGLSHHLEFMVNAVLTLVSLSFQDLLAPWKFSHSIRHLKISTWFEGPSQMPPL